VGSAATLAAAGPALGEIASSRSVVPEAHDRSNPAYAMSTMIDRFPAREDARPPLVRRRSHNFLRLTRMGSYRTATGADTPTCPLHRIPDLLGAKIKGAG
jgi:hypothetical protein